MTDVTLSVPDLMKGLRDAMEEAWDAGWKAAHAGNDDNPYRTEPK